MLEQTRAQPSASSHVVGEEEKVPLAVDAHARRGQGPTADFVVVANRLPVQQAAAPAATSGVPVLGD